jgi:hypothetical protein
MTTSGKPYDLPPGRTVDKANSAIDALHTAADDVVSTHNKMAALVRSYATAADQVGPGQEFGPAPQGQNWQPPKDPNGRKDAEALAENQTPHGGKTSIKDLYKGTSTAQGIDEKTMKGAQTKAVSDALEDARKADNGVKDAVVAYGNFISEGIGNAVRDVKTAFQNLELDATQRQADDAEAKKTALENEKKEAVAVITTATSIINKSAKFLTGDAEATRDLIGMAAEKVISMQFENEIKQQERNISAAKTKIRTLKSDIVTTAIESKLTSMFARIAELPGKRTKVAEALAARQRAYDEAAKKAADATIAAGGDPKQADRLRTAIAAIPRIELLLAKIREVISAASPPKYDSNAGLAYAVARRTGKGGPIAPFEHGIGAIKHFRAEFQALESTWAARLASARAIEQGLNVR